MAALEGSILVTGGTGALGTAVVSELLDAGARVATTWIAERERDALAEALPGRHGLELVQADLSDGDAVAAAVGTADSGPPLAGLVNLVGGFAAGGRVHEAPADEFERMLALNLMTAFRVSRAALPRMLAAGGGSIVCVGTRAALEPFSGASGYVVSKAAVLALVRTLSVEYVGDGVRTNAVLPSVIDTPGNRASMPDADQSTWVQPAEIARVIRFLCSSDSAPISGALVPVYGRA